MKTGRFPCTKFTCLRLWANVSHVFWQFITFGFACTPLYFVWEKVIGMHDTKSIFLRALVRLPVVIPIWFLAIIFPFFGPINSAVGALLVSFTVYIIPSLAHMLTFRSASARQVKMVPSLHFLSSFLTIVTTLSLIQVQLALSSPPWSSLVHYHLPHFEPIMTITNVMGTHACSLHGDQPNSFHVDFLGGAYWSFRQLCWVLIADY